MTRKDWLRLWMHVPWGLLAVGLFVFHPLLGFTACLSEIGYEVFDSIEKKDQSRKDVIGICWGILIGGYVLLTLKITGIDLGF